MDSAVVLSDPRTSYAIPGLTKHYVVLNEPSHGTREDMVIRFSEMREVLFSPYQSGEEALAALMRYDVNYIVVNRTLLNEIFFLQTPFYADFTLGFLRGNEACFKLRYTDAQFEVYEFTGCEPSEVRRKGRNREDDPSQGEDPEYRLDTPLAGNLSLQGFSFTGGPSITPGETLRVDLYWRARQPLYDPHAVWIDLLCPYPGIEQPYNKTLRKVNERLTGRIYGIESAAWLPVSPGGLDQGLLQMQTFRIQVPEMMVEGHCDLGLYILDRQQTMRDQEVLPVLLMEKRYTLPGARLGTVEVRR